MLVSPVIDRIEANVAALDKRTHGALELSELAKTGALPNVTPAAYVLPLGLRGGEVTTSSVNNFIQMLAEIVAVVLVLKTPGDVTGGRAVPKLDELIGAVIAALCGWAPSGEIGVFTFQSGQLVSMTAGSIVYQLNFTISDQVRITT